MGCSDVTFGVTLRIVGDGGDQHLLERSIAGCKIKVVEIFGAWNELNGSSWDVDLEDTPAIIAVVGDVVCFAFIVKQKNVGDAIWVVVDRDQATHFGGRSRAHIAEDSDWLSSSTYIGQGVAIGKLVDGAAAVQHYVVSSDFAAVVVILDENMGVCGVIRG